MTGAGRFAMWLLCSGMWFNVSARAETLTQRSSRNALKIPLVAVSQGESVDAALLDAAAKGLASPVARGEEILSALRIAALPADFTPERWLKVFDAGEADFFNGKLDTAERAFREVADFLTANPQVQGYFPTFREVWFKSHMFLAIIAHGSGDTPLFEQELTRAAEITEKAPSPTEFPPWVCAAFEGARHKLEEHPTGTLRVLGHEKCGVSVRGLSAGQGTTIEGVPVGTAYVRVRCGENAGPVQTIKIEKNKTAEMVPVLLESTALERRNGDIFLYAPDALSDDALIQDLTEFGRALKKDRLVVLVAKGDRTDLRLIDVGLRRAVRVATVQGATNEKSVQAAAEALTAESRPAPTAVPEKAIKARRRPWYRDWVAWTAALAGAASLGAGIALDLRYGLNSTQAPVAISLTAVGAGLVAAGGFMFMVQPAEDGGARPAGVTAGAFVGGTF